MTRAKSPSFKSLALAVCALPPRACMTRLSIIDLPGGKQPFHGCRMPVTAVVNGEIYNYVELREGLAGRGHIFRTNSDCEVIVHLYEELGPRCVEVLRGMFAIALWDARRQVMLLARDRMGEKPLYLYQGADTLVFASEMKALLASGVVPKRLDPTAIHEYFHYRYVPEPRTPLQDVSKLPAGHLMLVHRHPWRVEQQEYWSLADAPALDGDPVGALRAELRGLGPLITRADVPIGVALSGGLDSSAVPALAAEARSGPVHAFSLGYQGRPANDERSEARALAATLDLNFHEIEFGLRDVVDGFPQLVHDWDDPIADMAGFSYRAIARAASDHGVRVLLQGQGGDELFWGYPWVRRSLARSMQRLSDAPRGQRSDRLRPPLYDLDPDFQEARRRCRGLYERSFRDEVDRSTSFREFPLPDDPDSLAVDVTRAVRADRAGAEVARFPGRVVGGDDNGRTAVTRREFGVYRATKNNQVIGECVDLINHGGVAALVPASASGAYLEEIARQVERFAQSRTASTGDGSAGVLALPTSGSTGSPKLVAIPVAGIVRFLAWGEEHFGLSASTVSLSLSPWNFDVSLLDTWAVLAAGGVVVAADAARLYDARYLARLLVEHRPTFVQVVPSTLDALVNAAGDGIYTSVRDVVLTGGVASRSTRAAAARRFPAAAFYNVYGATEVNDCLVQTLSAEEFAEFDTLPLGTPIAGCEVVLSANGTVQPVGGSVDHAEGELLARTPWMALGYISDGELHPLPGTEVEGFGLLYPMKDRASCAAGRLTYLGRHDRTIKLRGQRVNLDEIEHAARQTGLAGMACAWVDDSATAQELHLAYTASAQGPLPASGLQLRLQMSRHLPAFAMPNHLHAFDNPFALNGNGKPDLSAIKRQTESE